MLFTPDRWKLGMTRIINYLRMHYGKVIFSLFIGYISMRLFIYFVSKYIAAFSYSPSYPILYTATIVILYITLLSVLCRRFSKFHVRYKNNFDLKVMPFTYVDVVCLIAITCIIMISYECGIHSNKMFLLLSLRYWFISLLSITVICYFYAISITNTDKILSNVPEPLNSNNNHFPDEPITDESQDLLGRGKFIDDLYHQIISYPFQNSFVFGLYGSWGEGKSSVLELLTNKLSNNNSVIVFRYSPWYFSSESAVIKSFYDGLYDSLNQQYFIPNIKHIFSKYQKLLSSGIKLTGLNIDFNVGQDSLDTLRQKISNWIDLLDKKIVILIDDIDRLQDKNEIYQIFKIAKLSGRFKKTIFVLSLDKAIIESYLKDDISKDVSYLHKIIQSPIRLPAIEQDDIDKFLYFSYPKLGHISAIDHLFEVLHIDDKRIKDFDNEFTILYNSDLKKLFPTLREAKRYLNAIYATLPVIKDEVNLYDFMLIEMIRVFYYDVYTDIWSNPSYLYSNWLKFEANSWFNTIL